MAPMMVKAGNVGIEVRTKERNHRRPHCHATYPSPVGPEAAASIALDNFEVIASYGFDEPTLNEIIRLVRENHDELLAKWEEIYGKK